MMLVAQVTAGLGFFCIQVIYVIVKIVTPLTALTGLAFLAGPLGDSVL